MRPKCTHDEIKEQVVTKVMDVGELEKSARFEASALAREPGHASMHGRTCKPATLKGGVGGTATCHIVGNYVSLARQDVRAV